MRLQLYMWYGTRAMFIERHDFYVEQVRARVLSQFRDISTEAERHGDKEFERISSVQLDEDYDEGAAAEQANDNAQAFYNLLSDLSKQMLLGAAAGIYHQWDKDLRDFVERELLNNIEPKQAERIAWDPNIGNVFDVLKDFGWDCRQLPLFAKIDACRLVVNVYKHGKGRSLVELTEKYPDYLSVGGLRAEMHAPFGSVVDYEDLAISEAHFDEFATAFRTFWAEFPERLFLEIN